MLVPHDSATKYGRTVADALRFLRREPHTVTIAVRVGHDAPALLVRITRGAALIALSARGIARGTALPSEFVNGFLYLGSAAAIEQFAREAGQ
jgi:hypothetical protein